MYELYMTKSENFTLAMSFADFEQIEKGQLIGVDGGQEIRAYKDSVIVFARNRKQINDEAFLLGEKNNDLE